MSEQDSGPVDERLIPDRSADDEDRGWGTEEPDAVDSDDERLKRERPPHW